MTAATAITDQPSIKYKKIGLIVNPIAGMGGKVALKGTDGPAVLAAAIKRGAVPEAGLKAERALRQLSSLKDRIVILTCSGSMGEDLCRKLGLPYQVAAACQAHSSSLDTIAAAKAIKAAKADLLLFAGGDGTARNICEAVGFDFPVLGIPAGVKIQSAVFAVSPESAGSLASIIVKGAPVVFCQREVVDLDEEAYRTGHVSATLYGVMSVPDQPAYLQNMKQSGFSSESEQLEGIAEYVTEHMEAGCCYAIGSGSTAKCVPARLGLSSELLGVDVIKDGRLIARDVTEGQLWQHAQGNDLRIIVSPIGGQGFLFGRGNHQFSARVLKAVGKDHITVISSMSKLLSISDHVLRVDCGDPDVNAMLHGYYNVVCGYRYFLSYRCG